MRRRHDGDRATASAPPMSVTVNATPGISFTPSPLNIVTGGTVTFAFGSVGHNVYFTPMPGSRRTFPDERQHQRDTHVSSDWDVRLRCHIHPGMTGTIVVGSASTVSDSGPTGYGSYNRS